MDAKLNTQNRVSPTKGINIPDFTRGRDAAYAAHREGIADLARAYSNVGAAIQYSGKVLYEYDQANVTKQYAADEAILKTKYAEQYAALSDRISKQAFSSSAEMKAAFEAGAQEIDERIADGIQNGFNNSDGTVFRFRNADRFEEPLRQLGEIQRATAMNTAVDKWIVEEDHRTQQAFDTQMSTAVLLSDRDGVQKVYEQMCNFYPARKELYAAKRDYALASIANKTAAAVRDTSLKLETNAAKMQLDYAVEAGDPDIADAALNRLIELKAVSPEYKEWKMKKEGLVYMGKVEREAGKIKDDIASAKAKYDKAEEDYNKKVAALGAEEAKAVIALGKATNDPKKFREGMDALAKSKGWSQKTADSYVAAFEAKVRAKRDKELLEESESEAAEEKKAAEKLDAHLKKLDAGVASAIRKLAETSGDAETFRSGLDILVKNDQMSETEATVLTAEFEARKKASRAAEEKKAAEKLDAHLKKLDAGVASAIRKLAETSGNAETFRSGLDILVKNDQMSEAEATVLTAEFEARKKASRAAEEKKAAEKLDAHLKKLDAGVASAIRKLAETSGNAETFRLGLDILVKNDQMSEAEATVLTAEFEARKKASRAADAHEEKKKELDLELANATELGDEDRVRRCVADRCLFLGESEELGQLRLERAKIDIANEKAKVARKQLSEEKAAKAKDEKEKARAAKAKAREEAKLAAEQAKRDKQGRDIEERIAKLTNDTELYADVQKRRVEAGEIDEDDAKNLNNLFSLTIAQKQMQAEGRFLVKDARKRFQLNLATAKELGDEQMAQDTYDMAVSYNLMSRETAAAGMVNFRIENRSVIRSTKTKQANTIAGAMTRKMEVDLRRTMQSDVRRLFTGGDVAKAQALVGIEESADDIKYRKELTRAEFEVEFDKSAPMMLDAYIEQLDAIPNLSDDDKNKNILAYQNMIERVKKSTWAQFEARLEQEALANSVRFKNGIIDMKYNKASIAQYSADPVYKNISMDDTYADAEYKFARDEMEATPMQKKAILAAYFVIGQADPDAPDFQQKVHRALSELRLSGNGVRQFDYEKVVGFATNLMEGKAKHKMGATEAKVYLDHVSAKLGKYFDVPKKKRTNVADAWRHINESEMSGDACDRVNNLIFQMPDLVNDLPTAMAIFDKAVEQIYVEDEEEKANMRADDVLSGNWLGGTVRGK